MRVLVAAALIVIGLAGVTAAGAADFPVGRSDGYSTGSYGHGRHAGQLLVYDSEPGVAVRPYWLAPWRHRHYFPATGMRPKIGRKENLAARAVAPKPAKTFRRSWSTASAFLPEASLASAPPRDPEPTPRIEHFPPPKAVRP